MAETRAEKDTTADDPAIVPAEVIPPDENRRAAEDSSRIVIVQRGGASVPLIMLPALILISAAAGILVYHQINPPATIPVEPTVASKPAEPAPEVSSEASRSPVEIRSILDPELVLGDRIPEIPAEKPAAIGFAPPVEADVIPAGLGAFADSNADAGKKADATEALLPPADAEDPGDEPEKVAESKPEPEPVKVTREDVLKDINREAAERQREIRAIEAMKPKLAERDRQKSMARRKVELAEAQKQADIQRPKFREELRRILAGKSKSHGDDVSDFRERSLLPVQPEIEDEVARVLGGNNRRTKYTRNDRILFMRSRGMSEPDILGILAYDEARKISQRGSARDLKEVWVRAARQLLAVPLNTDRAGGQAGPIGARQTSNPAR